MGSRIWPAPGSTEASGQQLAAAPDPTVCEHCGLEECECGWCPICDQKRPDCSCPCVYVVYATVVKVEVDYEGDVTRVWVDADLTDPQSVEDEDGNELSFNSPLAVRARESAANQDWPTWDIG